MRSIGVLLVIGCCACDGGMMTATPDSGISVDGGNADSAVAPDGVAPDGGTALDSGTMDAGPDPRVADPLGAPEIFGFEIRADGENNDRVYFESSEPITASDAAGFFLSDNLRKRITGIVVNGSFLTGHYFVADQDFDYWDTYAIRYEGGSDLADVDASALHEFWLTEVVNSIPEPAPTGTPYFVRTTGSDESDGLSHETAFRTINRAIGLEATTIYVEAGDYGSEQIRFDYNGTAERPIVVQGYKTQTAGIPDPIEENYWEWGSYGTGLEVRLDLAELPTLTGSDAIRLENRGPGTAIKMGDFCIVKNFQFTHWNRSFEILNADHIVLKNIVSIRSGSPANGSGGAVAVVGGQGQGTDMFNKFINITTAQGINMVRLYGGASLFDNIRIYNDGADRTPDYFISIYEGSNNVIRNCLVDKIGGFPGSHGIGFKSWDFVTEYNLIVDSTTINMFGGIELRHDHVKNNVVRNVQGFSRPDDDNFEYQTNGVVVRDNASANLVENSTFHHLHRGIYFTDQSGEQGYQTPGFDNVFRNIVIYDSAFALGTTGPAAEPLVYGNVFQNLTIDDCGRVFWSNASRIFNDSNSLINSSVSNTENWGNSAIDQSNNNFFGNEFRVPSGMNITTVDPLFSDPDTRDYTPTSASPLLGAGAATDNHYDLSGRERITPSIGAHAEAAP